MTWVKVQLDLEMAAATIEDAKAQVRAKPLPGSAIGSLAISPAVGNRFIAQLYGNLGESACIQYFGDRAQRYLTGPLRGSDGGIDLLIDGVPTQVKTAVWRNIRARIDPSYILAEKEEFVAERGILVVGDARAARNLLLVGWTHQSAFQRLFKMKDFGDGPRRCIGASDLFEMKLWP